MKAIAIRSFTSFASVGVLLLAACGGTEEAKPTGPKYPTKASFCDSLPKSVCQKALVDACNAPQTGCEQAVKARCTGLDVFFGISGAGYNNDKTEACLAEVTATFGDAKVTSDEFKKVGKACGAMLSAKLSAGSVCVTDVECGDGLHCSYSPVDKKATCSAGKAEAGDSCVSQGCKAGLICNASQSCAKGRAVGEACDDATTPCTVDLLCVNKQCTTKLSQGLPCQENGDCASGYCASVADGKRTCFEAFSYGAGSPACSQYLPLGGYSVQSTSSGGMVR